jgi:hypothetical protein
VRAAAPRWAVAAAVLWIEALREEEEEARLVLSAVEGVLLITRTSML